MGLPEQQEDGPRHRRRRAVVCAAAELRDLYESAVGRPEQLADVDQSDPTLRGLNYHATTGSGLTRLQHTGLRTTTCV
jgi:hypothetical protein